MRSMLLASVTAILVLSTGLFLALERPTWLPGTQEQEEPVLVFLVGHRSGVAALKAAVDPSRILAESPDAVALAEGRVVATDPSAVAAPLLAAGWGDRPVELLAVPRRRESADADAAEVDDERMARLMELVKKPSLSYGEAMVVMQAMNDGLL